MFLSIEAGADHEPSKKYLRSLKTKANKARTQMEAAGMVLYKKLQKQRALITELKTTYRFRHGTKESFNFMATIPSKVLRARKELVDKYRQAELDRLDQQRHHKSYIDNQMIVPDP